MTALTHFNTAGDAHMVDVGDKEITHRIAVAEGIIRMLPETLAMIQAGGHRKGDVLGIARIAAIMGAKRTADLVPLCHPLALTKVEVELETVAELQAYPGSSATDAAVLCRARVDTRGQTGVEMEALCAVQVGLLTVYDMCKAVDRGMRIDGVRLLSKAGGRSGDWTSAEPGSAVETQMRGSNEGRIKP